jgi:hypothetical protein
MVIHMSLVNFKIAVFRIFLKFTVSLLWFKTKILLKKQINKFHLSSGLRRSCDTNSTFMVINHAEAMNNCAPWRKFAVTEGSWKNFPYL